MGISYEKMEESFKQWQLRACEDKDLTEELQAMEGDRERITDAFYRELAFGTGGLRGVIGAGTNRMNVYTVGKATQGLAQYLLCQSEGGMPSAAISYDSRIKSYVFARRTAEVFAANGIRVWLYNRLMPTPMLSWAVRRLGCDGGVMITASHNPSRYNGYKVYGPDGCQITTEAAERIQSAIEAVDVFGGVKRGNFEEEMKQGMISYISEEIITEYIETVKAQSMAFGMELKKEMAIVYSPLNGTGREPVLRILRESGFSNVWTVKEQEFPDGHFPTCPYPNPEIPEAMSLGIRSAQEHQAELVLATDPDCDRVGIALRDKKGEYVLLGGNETGLLLLYYICSRRKELGQMPEQPVFVKTIVTTDLASRIAEDFGVRTVDVLTGFKFIGEQIGLLEKEGREKDFILGFEESYGYLSGSHVRDKDAVNGAYMICEMYAYYRSKGISLLEVLEELYRRYGYCSNTLHSYEFEGMKGFERMQEIMKCLHGLTITEETQIGGLRVLAVEDYLTGRILKDLPPSDVLKFRLEGNSSVVVRPSGTEPKLKLYISVSAQSPDHASIVERRIREWMEGYFL